jgi:VWFA-related protein
MKFIIYPLLSVLVCGVLVAQDPFTLSVDVDMVLFNVSVTDDQGKPISGLTQDNFKIYEDGREQAIYSFQPENVPATVGLVIDNSGSMLNKRTQVINAALTFLKESNPADEVFILNFNERIWMGLPESVSFSNDLSLLKSALMATRAAGKTALYDAIGRGLTHLEKGSRQRKALVVLSDGGDTASQLDFDDALDRVRKSNATVYAIGILDPYQRDRNPGILTKITKAGGGEAHFPHGLSDLPEIWGKIAGGIRSQYTLGYYSTNRKADGKFRKVTIKATGKNRKSLQVHTREGYVAKGMQGKGEK